MATKLPQRTLEALRALRHKELEQARRTSADAEQTVRSHEERLGVLRSKIDAMQALPLTSSGPVTAATLQLAEANRARAERTRNLARKQAEHLEQTLPAARELAAQARARLCQAAHALRAVEGRIKAHSSALLRARRQRWDEDQDELLSSALSETNPGAAR